MKSKIARGYRYIRAGCVDYDAPLSKYNLFSGNALGDSASCIRIEVPANFETTKYNCDPYSETKDKRSLNTLGYDILVKQNGKWVIRNDLKPIQPYAIHEAMTKEKMLPVKGLGYLTVTQYDVYMKARDAKIRKALEETQALPDDKEFDGKYAMIWHEVDGNIGWALFDDEFSANLSLKTMQGICLDAYLIPPKTKK